MTTSLVIVGAGGFGREVMDVVEAINSAAAATVWSIVGVVDDAPTDVNLERLAERRIEYIGATDAALQWHDPPHYVVGIGNPRIRKRIAGAFDDAGFPAATLIHPTSTRGFNVTLGDGSIICAGVRLSTNIGLGRHVHLNPNVTVGHDTTLGDFVSVNPLAAVSGDCTIESGVLVGVAGVILNGRTVGADSTVGGSACVVSDVPPGSTVKGVPAK